jgi:hypothetical protein
MSFCTDRCLSGMSETDKTALFNRIRRKIGAPVMQVELVDEQIEECICEAIEEYSTYINNWVLTNRLGEILGLPSDMDFTLKYVSNSLYFEKSFGKSIAEQAGLGADGTREIKTTSIILTAGTQNYIIPAGREVNDVLWFTPSFINLFGLDPFANTNIAFSEFGASFAGHTLYHVMPVFDTIMTAQAAELRNRVRGSEYSYIIRPGAEGTKILTLYPIPNPNGGVGGAGGAGTNAGGIGGGAGTPGTVFYCYYDRNSNFGNPDYSGNTSNPGWTGYSNTQISQGFQGNGLVSTPADAKLNYISYMQLNSVAQTWVKKYAQALAKETLGIGIRGKFNGTLPIPDAELTLNKDDLISTAREDKSILKEELKAQLDELSYNKIMENRALIQENVNKALSFGPMGIYLW